MPHHIGHENAERRWSNLNEIIDVAGHGCHRHVPDSHIDALRFRHLSRKKGGLDLASRVELALNAEKVRLAPEHRSRDRVCEAQDEDEDSDWLDVHSTREDLAGILIDDSEHDDQTADYHYWFCQRRVYATNCGSVNDVGQ